MIIDGSMFDNVDPIELRVKEMPKERLIRLLRLCVENGDICLANMIKKQLKSLAKKEGPLDAA